jgi:hypothetical protein
VLEVVVPQRKMIPQAEVIPRVHPCKTSLVQSHCHALCGSGKSRLGEAEDVSRGKLCEEATAEVLLIILIFVCDVLGIRLAYMCTHCGVCVWWCVWWW